MVTCGSRVRARARSLGENSALRVRISPAYFYPGVAEYYFRLGSFGSPFAGIDPESSNRLWEKSCTSLPT